MTKPTIIKGPLPGQAVEEFRLRNGGKLPGANVVVSLDMVDDALSLLEGWIRRYCKPSFLSEHLDDLTERRAALASAPEQTPIAVSETTQSFEDGTTPVDVEKLRQGNCDLAAENLRLRQALRFYANGDHWIVEGASKDVWDTCSGEPQNWFWRSNERDDAEGIEDGGIAKLALQGKEVNWDGDEPELVEGEPEYEIAKLAEKAP